MKRPISFIQIKLSKYSKIEEESKSRVSSTCMINLIHAYKANIILHKSIMQSKLNKNEETRKFEFERVNEIFSDSIDYAPIFFRQTISAHDEGAVQQHTWIEDANVRNLQ